MPAGGGIEVGAQFEQVNSLAQVAIRGRSATPDAIDLPTNVFRSG
jgi:hypothetical protein